MRDTPFRYTHTINESQSLRVSGMSGRQTGCFLRLKTTRLPGCRQQKFYSLFMYVLFLSIRHENSIFFSLFLIIYVRNIFFLLLHNESNEN